MYHDIALYKFLISIYLSIRRRRGLHATSSVNHAYCTTTIPSRYPQRQSRRLPQRFTDYRM